MSKAASFQYTNPLSEDPLQGFKDCLSEFAHRRNSCPTDPFASPLVSPEVSDSSTNSQLHNHEDYPPLSPRSHSLTAQVRANQVFALQEGPESQGARRRPRVYKVKCDEIRGWGLVLEENVSLLDPACHLVAVKKVGRAPGWRGVRHQWFLAFGVWKSQVSLRILLDKFHNMGH